MWRDGGGQRGTGYQHPPFLYNISTCGFRSYDWPCLPPTCTVAGPARKLGVDKRALSLGGAARAACPSYEPYSRWW